MFCIFIGVTFANLGREGKESGKMRNPICYRTKENSYYKIKMHRLITSQCIKLVNINTKQIIYDDALSYYECNLRQDSTYNPQ